ncbi:MAG: nucleotide exchange factor GrpE [Pseudomonadota bacterium]
MKADKAFLRNKFIEFQLKIADLNHALAEQKSRFSGKQTHLYLELLDILDAFEAVEGTLAAKEDTLDKTARMLGKNIHSIHKKLSRLIQSRGIFRMEFPDGKARMDLCRVTETQPRADLENETILSIVKSGYIDNETGTVLRKAEVVTVSNEK